MPSKEYKELSERQNALEKEVRRVKDENESLREEKEVALAEMTERLEENEEELKKASVFKQALEEFLGAAPLKRGDVVDEQDVDLNQTRLTIRTKQVPKDVGPVEDTTLRGKILAVLPAEKKWLSTKEVQELLAGPPYFQQVHDAPVSEELNKMADEEWLAKRRNANRTVSYRVPDNVTILRSE